MAGPTNIHASAIVVDGIGLAIVGPSGSGKSALAFDCLSEAKLLGLSAALISDDRLLVFKDGSTVIGRAPDTMRGMIELRYSGIIKVAHIETAPLHLVATTVASNEVERLPPENEHYSLTADIALPLVRVPSWTRFPLSLILAFNRQSADSAI
ncbi:HPr kinase/phosphorylase [Rhizobium sp. G187]|uniref:HPr kinase/phosphorylase n=1 Tax=Rhizobium sp. G187 TaxID=3451352 RepID=UPI003EE67ECE